MLHHCLAPILCEIVLFRVQTAITACEPGGRIVLVGMGQEEMTLPMALASIREIDIYGSFRYCNTVCHGFKMSITLAPCIHAVQRSLHVL